MSTEPDPMRVLALTGYAEQLAGYLTEEYSGDPITAAGVLDALGSLGITLVRTPTEVEGLAIVAALLSCENPLAEPSDTLGHD